MNEMHEPTSHEPNEMNKNIFIRGVLIKIYYCNTVLNIEWVLSSMP